MQKNQEDQAQKVKITNNYHKKILKREIVI
jgi:hypothetical protein